MATPRDNRRLIRLLANDADEGDVLQCYVLLLVFIGAGIYCAADVSLSCYDVLPLSIKLLALFVVFSSMKELAIITFFLEELALVLV